MIDPKLVTCQLWKNKIERALAEEAWIRQHLFFSQEPPPTRWVRFKRGVQRRLNRGKVYFETLGKAVIGRDLVDRDEVDW